MKRTMLVTVAFLIGCGGGSNPMNGGPDAGSNPWASLAADNGFRPVKDGFGFQNYTNMGMPVNLSSEDVLGIFGDGVCATPAGMPCTLTPAAYEWANAASEIMNGGHCFGMSHLANAIYMGKVPLAAFKGGASTNALMLEGNVPLQRGIGVAFIQQILSPSMDAAMKSMAPMDLVNFLSKALASKAETYTIAFFKTDPNGKKAGGHAVTPYAIVPDTGKIKVMVYDNNFPGEERSIIVDPVANTWTYVAAANPNDMASAYTGDAKTLSIGVFPVTPGLAMQKCDFCANMGAQGSVQVAGSGLAGLSISDGQGHTIDDVNNNFPGASDDPLVSDGPLITNLEPTYKLPGGSDLDITIDGTTLAAPSGESIRAFGPGWVLGVEDLNLSPGQKDIVHVTKAGDSVTYTTTSMETPTVIFGVQTAGPDYEFRIKVSGDGKGQTAILRIDLAKSRLALQIKSNGSTDYAIDMIRTDDKGQQEFTHAGNSESGMDTVYLDFGSWGGQGTPMTIEVDQGSDGTIDSTQMLSDDA